MPAKKSTEVAEVQNSVLGNLVVSQEDVNNQLPAHLQNESKRGSENVTQEDVTVPRLKMLQYISDELKRGHESYDENAEAGMLKHSITGELLGDEVYVINVMYSRRWNLWRTRKAGGGLIKSCASATEAQEELAKICEAERIPLDDKQRIEETFEIVDTPEHACLLVDPKTGEFSPVIVDMPKTKQKVSNRWNSTFQNLPGDRFAHLFRLYSRTEQNSKKEDYKNYDFEHKGYLNVELYKKAEAFYENIRAYYTGEAVDLEGTSAQEADESGAE